MTSKTATFVPKIRKVEPKQCRHLRSSVVESTHSFAKAMKSIAAFVISHTNLGIGGGLRLFFDSSRLCFSIETHDCGIEVDHSTFSENEDFQAIAQFALVCVICRRKGLLETTEMIWQGGEFIYNGPSSRVMHSYGLKIIVKDFLFNIPVRQKLLLKTAKAMHLHSIRNELLPVILSNREISLELFDWSLTSSLFSVKPDMSVREALEEIIGLGQNALDTVSAQIDLWKSKFHFVKSTHLSGGGHFQFCFVNGVQCKCTVLEGSLCTFAKNLLTGEAPISVRKNFTFSYVLFLNGPHSEYEIQDGRIIVADEYLLTRVLKRLTNAILTSIHGGTQAPDLVPSYKCSCCPIGTFQFAPFTKHGLSSEFGLTKGRSRAIAKCLPASMDSSQSFRLLYQDGNTAKPSCNLPKVEDLAYIENGIKPNEVHRDMLLNFRCLGQVGKKFIVVVCGDVLLLFDQHAADERIRLEHLTAQISKKVDGLLKATKACIPFLQFHANLQELHALEAYKEKVESWGWNYTHSNYRRVVEITEVPCIDGRALGIQDLKLYLDQLQHTHGADAMPVGVHCALASRACRSAIKFGDFLAKDDCTSLINSLACTSMSFHCAHGRPTCVPIVNMSKLHCAQKKIVKRTKRKIRMEQLRNRLKV